MSLLKKENNPAHIIHCFLKGLKLLTRAELRKYLIIPILINFVLYSVALTLGYFYISDLITQFIPGWLSWLEWLIWPLFFVSFLLIGFFTFTILANLIAAPFYCKLAAKTLEIISGEKQKVEELPISQVLTAELKRIGYLVSRMLPLLILFIIPGINLIAPFLWALFGAWGMGLEFMAYPLENQGLLFDQQKQDAKTRRMGVLSFGGITIVGLSIPVVNLLVAPTAVIGATIYIYELNNN
ncbi:MAG: sulfate transporter CysZ [Methylococcales bacterium]|nr:sulfate transporter CysZ [Methylococcales bacterium]